MKKRILSCLMALALCLTLLPTAAFAEEPEGTAQTSPAVEEAADPANGKAKQENQPAEQEEQQEDSATKQDEDVAAVQAMIDALPDAAELDGMDDADALAVYEAFQTACDAYYDTLTEGQQAQLKNTEKLAALSERFSQPETLAAGDHQDHCVCGKSGCTETGHDKITFNKWLASMGYTLDVGEGSKIDGTGQKPEAGKYVLSGDNYYLRANITIDHPIQIKGTVTICLNGHTIESKAKDQPVFEVVSSGTLTLTDCGSAGKVTSAYNGGGVEVNGGTFNLYGGEITGNTAAKGGGVYVYNSGEFNMYGGAKITDNKAAGHTSGTGNGGGVYVSGGTFNMRGGSITNNTTEVYAKGEGDSGGVYVVNGTFTMSGGTISGNRTDSTKGTNGGVGVYNDATFIMNGGTISGNKAKSQGGGVGVYSRGTFTMNGGTIGGTNDGDANTAAKGGGVYVSNGGKFTMSGGEISRNTTTTGDGGGVYMDGITFTVSGAAVIKDNKKGTANNNVYLPGSKPIIIGGALADGASIGVTTKNEPAADGAVIATGNNLTDKDAAKFFSDKSGYAVSAKSDGTGLVLVKAHTHFLCGRDGCNGNGHTCQAVTFTAWTDSKKLPETKGEYYLDTDVTLSSSWKPVDGTVLCLNGHSITADDNITAIYVNNAFTLCDCKGGKDAYGQITHAVGKTGGGVYMTGGQFTMYGGEISRNTATTGNGGGVYVGGGTFTMNYSASVKDNTASGNTADQGNGGGVYVYSGTFTMNDTASVSSNKATNNETTNTTYGGGVYVKSTNSTFTMNDKASITGNTATNGGGVYVNTGSQFNMNGNASIKSNIGNGVCVSNNATFTVSDAPTVTGNTMNKDASNVYLEGGAYITIGGALNGGKGSIGVTKTVDGGVIAKNVSADYSGCFFSDKTQYVVKYDNKQLVLKKAETQPSAGEHKHYLCGGKTACNKVGGHSCEATTFATKLWMDNGVLKKGNDVWTKGTVNRADGGAVSHEGYVLTTGNYYLEKDLTLNGAAILIDGDVKLCLNGHTIDRANGNAALDNVIWVLGKNNAHLTLTDCVGGGTIKGGGNGGVDIFGFCTLDMFGGTITGNTNSGVNVGQFGKFNMYGGKITGNSAGYGGGVYTYGKFTMSGGSITKNTATEKGGGVLVGGGTFTVSGNVNITDNTVNNERNNVYLSKANKTVIGVAGALSGKIGVTPEKWPDGNDQVAIASGVSAATGGTHYDMKSTDMNCFQSDNGEYQISLANNMALLAKKGTVTPGNIPVSGVALNKTSTSISVGNSEKLIATVEPSNATDKRVTWASSNENVATVDANGTVTAVKAGTAAITATAADGSGKYATCTVTVTGGTTPSQPGGGSSGGGGGSSSGGSSGGGGSSSPSNHPVKAEVSKDPDGSVSLSKTSAAKGDKVTITVKPERHYAVDKVIVRDSKGKQLAVKDNGDGTFTFEMPADKVTVEPSFSWVNPFADVADSAYYVDAVEWMLKREVTQGTTETTFSPDLNCTRAQIVTFLWRVAGSPAPKGTVSFADVSADSYYAKAVAWAVENGITDGIGGGLFSPDATCTRAQSAVFLYRVAGSPAVNGSAGFSDVAADAYYAQAVAWAKEHGITDGIGGGLFGSANDCTRAQIAAFLYRYMK